MNGGRPPRAGRRRVPACGELSRGLEDGGMPMQPLAVRYAVPMDLAAVHAVIHSAYRHYVGRIGARPAPLDADYPHLMRRGCLFVVGNPAIATITLLPEDGWLYLDNLAVAPDRQGQGLGRGLLAFA